MGEATPLPIAIVEGSDLARPSPSRWTAPDPRVGIDSVRSAIASACAEVGRDASTVTLIAVSKTFPAEAIRHAIDGGQLCFGENRIQEAGQKWPGIRVEHPAVELHLLGPIQRNKARTAIELFDVIHSVDRVELCVALARHRDDGVSLPELFVQVNTGCEPQKAGVLPANAPRFLAECASVYGLTLSGLMCIPPKAEPPEPHFELLERLAADSGLRHLSMGMSADFAAAIRHGATHVRIGRAIFGQRNDPKC